MELLGLALSDGVYDDTEVKCMDDIQVKLGLSTSFAKEANVWLVNYLEYVKKGYKLVENSL